MTSAVVDATLTPPIVPGRDGGGTGVAVPDVAPPVRTGVAGAPGDATRPVGTGLCERFDDTSVRPHSSSASRDDGGTSGCG